MNTISWAAPPLDINSPSVLSSIERGLTVSLIATFEPLVCCQTNAQISDLLETPKFGPFDYLPVKVEGRIVGLLPLIHLRTGNTNHRNAGEEMLPLDERRLVSADVGILSFIEQADEQHACRLVVRGTRIDGIVTLSDLQKLPVRPALFLFVTHFELLMSETIRRHFQEPDAWLKTLTAGRQQKVRDNWERLNAENLAIDMISASEFCDKRQVLLTLNNLADSRKQSEKQLKAIEDLRDSLAHSSDFALTRANALNAVAVTKIARKWIDHLTAGLKQ